MFTSDDCIIKMDEAFKIYIRRLSEGNQERIEETVSSEFLEISEQDLQFGNTVSIQGMASLVDETLVLNINATTEAMLPCAVCNMPTQVKISVRDFCYTEESRQISDGIFDYREMLRESILLEIPYTAECCDGNCPSRDEILKKYVSRSDSCFASLDFLSLPKPPEELDLG